MERVILEGCAATIGALKCGNLFAVPEKEGVWGEIRFWQTMLWERGLILTPLSRRRGYIQLYLYRPRMVREALGLPASVFFLQDLGYRDLSPAPAVRRLRRRMEEAGYPHEISLFLGYPIEDVKGFIEHGGRDYRYAGEWKVYGDIASAKARFAAFRACRREYLARWEEGESLRELIDTAVQKSVRYKS